MVLDCLNIVMCPQQQLRPSRSRCQPVARALQPPLLRETQVRSTTAVLDLRAIRYRWGSPSSACAEGRPVRAATM